MKLNGGQWQVALLWDVKQCPLRLPQGETAVELPITGHTFSKSAACNKERESILPVGCIRSLSVIDLSLLRD
jgi:hypothetical protein